MQLITVCVVTMSLHNMCEDENGVDWLTANANLCECDDIITTHAGRQHHYNVL